MTGDDSRDPMLVALLFNECINEGDLESLCALMAPEYVFIDAAGARIADGEVIREAWRNFFERYPDYRNRFLVVRCTSSTVSIRGYSTCSAGGLDGPALWSVRIASGRVAEWRVWVDTPGNRKLLGLS